MVAALRSFARTFTERVGALDDAFLGLDRPLGHARLLWEIGAAPSDGVDVAGLRRRLGLDSGYVSRILRALEADDLVTVEADPGDRRVRIVRLTARGHAEWDDLEERSERRATEVCGDLDTRRRDELVELLGQAERLLLAASPDFETVDARSDEAVTAVTAYFTELDERFPTGFDEWDAISADAADFDRPHGAFVLVRCGDAVAGCGGVQTLGAGIGEIKRMWIGSAWRGLGLAPRLLAHLEGLIVAAGHHTVRLDTNAVLTDAIRMYERAGYRSIDRYNDNPYAQRWFEKPLAQLGKDPG